MWDNHEFSWKGWQSQQNFSGVRPAQSRKVAANQAWFEYQPARVVKPGNQQIDRYDPPAVIDKPIHDFDDHGIGLEPGNLAAINSLKLFRAFRYGQNVELILTDNRSFRSEPVVDQLTSGPFGWTNLERRATSASHPLQWRGSSQSAHECSAAVDAWCGTKSMVFGSAALFEGNVEALGQFGRHARLAHRFSKPTERGWHAVAYHRLCVIQR